MSEKKMPAVRKYATIQELYEDVNLAIKHDELNVILSQNPPDNWVKVNKYANNSLYLPIDKVEWMLRRFFKEFKIEITGQGTAFNGVWVSVRVHYRHPVSNAWEYHDGIGAQELQVKAGSSAADLANINRNALSMAFPIAKSFAVKDACDHFGSVFGANLNRKDVLGVTPDEKLQDVKQLKEIERLKRLIDLSKDMAELNEYAGFVEEMDNEDLTYFYNKKADSFKV